MNIALLMMGGSGTRFGANVPKQFVEIDGRPIFSYILKGLDQVKSINQIIVVAHKDWIDVVEEWGKRLSCSKIYAVVPGGSSRSESVLNGLKKAAEIADKDAIVMMHDATHPYVDEKGIDEMISAVTEYGGATLGQRQYDTCYRIDENDILQAVIPRQYIVSGASPEAFFFKDIFKIYLDASKEELDAMTCAGAIALEHGIKMKVCTLNTLNLKITYPEDMRLLEKTIHTYFFEEEK